MFGTGLVLARPKGGTLAKPSTLLNNLAVYYQLESTADALGVNTLTNNGAVTFTSGKLGKAGTFASASSQYLSRASNATLQGGDIDLTLDCFVKLTDKAATQVLVAKHDGAVANSEYQLLYRQASDRFRFAVCDGATSCDVVDANTFGSPAAGTWYYIRCWRDKTQGKIFISVNNGAADSTVQTVTPGVNGTEFRIGANTAGSYANAQIDEVAIWKRLLTPAEAAARYNAGAASTHPWNWGPYDIFIIAGQSNAEGVGTNPQSYSHATLRAALFANDYQYKNLADPTDSNAGQVDAVSSDSDAAGSYWPPLATSIMAATGRPVMFVPCALSGTSIAQWQPGADHQDRTTLYGSMVYRANQVKNAGVGTLRAVLWHQGEYDANDAVQTPQATYDAGLDTLANAVGADLRISLMPCKLQHMTNAAHSNDYRVTINAAIAAAWADNPNVLAGPDFSDITPSVDGLHFMTDGELATAAGRWWTAIQAAFGW